MPSGRRGGARSDTRAPGERAETFAERHVGIASAREPLRHDGDGRLERDARHLGNNPVLVEQVTWSHNEAGDGRDTTRDDWDDADRLLLCAREFFRQPGFVGRTVVTTSDEQGRILETGGAVGGGGANLVWYRDDDACLDNP